MKVTFEFEYPCQLIDLLESLAKSSIGKQSVACTVPKEPINFSTCDPIDSCDSSEYDN